MSAEREMVAVEQCDREAGAALVEEQFMLATVPQQIRNGEYDDHPAVEAFARHRINCLSAVIDEECAMIVTWLRGEERSLRAQWIADLLPKADFLREYADTIERGEHRNRETRRG